MAFDYPEPAKAQAVMQSYVTQFLRMDSDQIEDQANLTVRFLSEQAAKLQAQVQAIESQITQLKASNGAALAGVGGTTFMDTGSYTAQITALENQNRQLMAQSRGGAADPALAAAEAALAVAESMYSDSHPDVITARERVATLKRAQVRAAAGISSVVQEQIKSNNAAIAQLMAQRDAAMSRVNDPQWRARPGAPAILERAMQLEAQANNIRQQYSKVSSDLLRAQSSARLANEQRAERLSLVEPPNLPDQPALAEPAARHRRRSGCGTCARFPSRASRRTAEPADAKPGAGSVHGSSRCLAWYQFFRQIRVRSASGILQEARGRSCIIPYITHPECRR